MMDSLPINTSTPPHLRHHHRTLSSRVPYYGASSTSAISATTSPSAAMHSGDCREDEGLMFQLDLEDDKLTAAGLACASNDNHMPWAHYTSRLPSYTITAQPLRPATASPSFYRTSPLPSSASATQPVKCGSVQLVHRASLSPTIPTLSSRMRSSTVSTPVTRTAVPSPSARLIKAMPLSPAASTTSSSSCVSQCSSTSASASASDDDDCPSLDYTLSPCSPPSPASPVALLTTASPHPHTSSLPCRVSSLPLPVAPSLPRAFTGPGTKAQQWRSEKGMSVKAGEEVKRASMAAAKRAVEDSEMGADIFELEL